MRFLDLILKKKAGQQLSPQEITYLVEAYTTGKVPDYQVSALLMAICFQGLDPQETAGLTLAMADSGDRIDLSAIPQPIVDKHSTGGVGDKTTLVIAPIAAALGMRMAKMSGRGLGHTGGTIDKLESIPGLTTDLAEADFIRQVRELGLAVAGQTANLAPADKKLYALRDVTGTVDQPSLIASSILSKKIAAGAKKIVLDVKCGSGAFMKRQEAAEALARTMIDIGEAAGLDVHCVISNMDQPLGLAVGNRLEVYEAVQTLRGEGPQDLVDLSLALAEEMYVLSGLSADVNEEAQAVSEVITSGQALAKLKDMVVAQGGDASYIDEPTKLLTAAYTQDYVASRSGYIFHMDSEAIGLAAGLLGAGRSALDDVIDPDAGLVFDVKTGARVTPGERIVTLYASDPDLFPAAIAKLDEAIEIRDEAPEKLPTVMKRLRSKPQ